MPGGVNLKGMKVDEKAMVHTEAKKMDKIR